MAGILASKQGKVLGAPRKSKCFYVQSPSRSRRFCEMSESSSMALLGNCFMGARASVMWCIKMRSRSRPWSLDNRVIDKIFIKGFISCLRTGFGKSLDIHDPITREQLDFAQFQGTTALQAHDLERLQLLHSPIFLSTYKTQRHHRGKCITTPSCGLWAQEPPTVPDSLGRSRPSGSFTNPAPNGSTLLKSPKSASSQGGGQTSSPSHDRSHPRARALVRAPAPSPLAHRQETRPHRPRRGDLPTAGLWTRAAAAPAGVAPARPPVWHARALSLPPVPVPVPVPDPSPPGRPRGCRPRRLRRGALLRRV